MNLPDCPVMPTVNVAAEMPVDRESLMERKSLNGARATAPVSHLA